MDDAGLRAMYQRASGGATDRGDDLDPARLAALAEGRIPEDEALALLDRVMADPALRRDFALLRAVQAAAAEPQSSPKGHHWWRTRWALAAAALAVAVAIPASWTLLRPPPLTTDVRGVRPTVDLLAPEEDAAATGDVLLVWRPVEGTLRYRIEVLDADANVVFDSVLTDTSVTLPRARLGAGRRYVWMVEAIGAAGDQRSPSRSFSTTASGDR